MNPLQWASDQLSMLWRSGTADSGDGDASASASAPTSTPSAPLSSSSSSTTAQYKHKHLQTPQQEARFKAWVKTLEVKPTWAECRDWIVSNIDTDLQFSRWTYPNHFEAFINDAIAEAASEAYGHVDPDANRYPGYGLALGHLPPASQRFPVLSGDEHTDWSADTLTIREVCMLRVVEELTNKPEWWLKVRDPEIAARWQKEALAMDWPAYREYADFTPAMAEACINEVRAKAELYEKTKLIPVMDYSACVLKSDSLVPQTLFDALRRAVAPLENVPEDRRDWHPGSDGKVLDLVHPSLWPLIYGRSRVLPLGTLLSRQDALASCGTGRVLARPKKAEAARGKLSHGSVLDPERARIPSISENYQWLPCDVVVTLDESDENSSIKVSIASYVNNLHPVQHAPLYPLLERFIALALPAWDIVYRWPREFAGTRLSPSEVGTECLVPDECRGDQSPKGWWECRPANRPLDGDEEPREEDEEYTSDYEESDRGVRDMDWFDRTHPMQLPDPAPEPVLKLRPEHVRTGAAGSSEPGPFSGIATLPGRLQVIVKLANIHLTPEKPTYDGGSWHVEGQLNEHICATALFYYDADNITDCRLALRTPANAESLCENLDYAQNDHRAIDRTFAIDSAGDTLQHVGAVLTRQGRALFFPNVYQHRVEPFRLADPARPGHRKILALFLVDPAIPVLSTANVPPQQRHWWTDESRLGREPGRLPPELTSLVLEKLDFPIAEDEAKRIRELLMDERRVLQQDTNGKLEQVEWNFCEH